MTWIKAASIEELEDKPIVFNHPPRQIALFKTGDILYAIDNRCPHEGYPLAVGDVSSDCVLTCNWHNWKFRLEDGECVLGGDHVRSYPTRQEDGHAWIDVTEPPPEETLRRIFRGLETAFEKRDFGRICREITRLHYHDLDTKEAVGQALRWSHDHLEFGTTHAFAAASDWLALADRFSDEFEPRVVCTAEAVDHLAWDSLRRPVYRYAEASGERFEPTSFGALIEVEQKELAEAMVSQGLADGNHWNDMEEAFTEAALAHYNDFGHSLIYVAKAGQLIDALGPQVEAPVLLPLTRHLIYTTREDLIPEFKGYRPALERLPEPEARSDSTRRLDVPFPATTRKALEWLAESLATHDVGDVYDRLLEANARNMLHFDTSYGTAHDRPVSQNISWLDFTHAITFSNAVRVMCTKYPRLWRPALAQMACFLGRNFRFIDKQISSDGWRVEQPADFFNEVHQTLLDHGLRDPIFSSHLLKTSTAVEGELKFASDSCRDALLMSLNRFLHSPIKTKHVRRLARQAIALVARDFAP